MKKILLLSLFTFTTLAGHADEGMWMLTDLKEQNAATMYDMGLDISIDKVYCPDSISLKDAVVHFGGGCTGEIISAEGLVLTNHHCGYSYIQQHSSVEHDYLTDGFWAMSRKEELPCKGLTVTFIDRILDVTPYVKEQLAKDEDPEGLNYLSPSYLSKVAKRFAEQEKIEITPFTALELKPFYGANRYYLFIKTIYKDVRMVGAPPSSIGKFGADTDNWMWPRHCGDFSMFRIYATPDGKPADYNESNVPLKVKKHLTINLGGIKEGDFTFVMGFPGRNWRYMISDEVEERMQTTNFMRKTVRTVRLNNLLEEMLKSDKVRIQYASKFAGSSNYWKNSIGMNKAIIDNDVLGTKAKQEKNFAEFAKGKTEYEGVVERIDEIIAKRMPVTRQFNYLYEALSGAIEFGSPYMIMHKIKTALKEKNDSLLAASKAQLEEVFNDIHNKDYDHEVDRAVAKAILPALAQKLQPEQLPVFYQTIQSKYKGDYNAFVDDMYDNSILANRTNFDKFMKKPTVKAIEKDPATAYSRSKIEKLKAVSIEEKALSNGLELLHKAYIRGLGEMKLPVPSYPDANFTLRLTYGNVKAYSPRDAIHYNYYTTTDGILEKENPEDREFVVPAKLLSLIHI